MSEHEHNLKPENLSRDDYGQYSPGVKALLKAMNTAFISLALIISGMLIWFFTFGGYFTVKPQEAVLVLRFGEIVDVFQDSWHWVLPYPVNSLIRIPVSSRSVATSSYMPAKSTGIDGAAAPPSESLIPGKDGYLLTGDANIIHSEWSAVYRVSNPKKYYLSTLTPEKPADSDEQMRDPVTRESYGTRGPQTILRNLLDNTVLRITASWKAEDALYKDSFGYIKAVEKEYIKQVTALDIGVTVDSVSLRMKTPPPSAIGAFQDVIVAEQQSSKEKDTARAYAVEQLNLASSESSLILAEADSYKKRVVAQVIADKFYFNKIKTEYSENPDTVLVSLYNSTLASVISSVKEKFIISKDRNGNQELRLKLNPEPQIQAPAKKEENKDK